MNYQGAEHVITLLWIWLCTKTSKTQQVVLYWVIEQGRTSDHFKTEKRSQLRFVLLYGILESQRRQSCSTTEQSTPSYFLAVYECINRKKTPKLYKRANRKRILKPGLHDAICLTDSFVFTQGHCLNWKTMRYQSASFNSIYNIPRACLLNRSPVPAMDLKAMDQACDVTCWKLVLGWEDYVANIQTVSLDMIKLNTVAAGQKYSVARHEFHVA